jgi:type IV secretory pathway TrbF-like protein
MPEECNAPSVTVNGQTLPQADDAEWRRIEQAYQEVQRRDERAEYRTWKAERRMAAVLLLLLAMVGWNIWLWLEHRKVQAVVQVVQVDEQHRVVQLGLPQDLLAYEPPEGLYMDMLGQWVRSMRWRDDEDSKKVTRMQWAWVYRHTCGQARRLLQAIEDREQPFRPSKTLVAVELKSITKTAVPEGYQVLWSETSTERSSPSVKTTQWSGTFGVGRTQLATLTDAMENRLGLCVTAFDMSEVPSSK